MELQIGYIPSLMVREKLSFNCGIPCGFNLARLWTLATREPPHFWPQQAPGTNHFTLHEFINPILNRSWLAQKYGQNSKTRSTGHGPVKDSRKNKQGSNYKHKQKASQNNKVILENKKKTWRRCPPVTYIYVCFNDSNDKKNKHANAQTKDKKIHLAALAWRVALR